MSAVRSDILSPDIFHCCAGRCPASIIDGGSWSYVTLFMPVNSTTRSTASVSAMRICNRVEWDSLMPVVGCTATQE